MKNRYLVLTFLLCLIGFRVNAQEQSTKDFFNLSGGGVFQANKVTGVTTITGKGGLVIGDTYLDSNWHSSSIKLYQKIGSIGRESDSIPPVALRYDIYNDAFEIMVSKNDIRGLKGEKVKFFVERQSEGQQPRVFVNLREFLSEESLTGFAEILSGGRVTLLSITKVSTTKPTYNEALNSGTKDVRIIKTPQFYYVRSRSILKLGGSKKKIIEALGDKGTDVEEWLKKQDLDLKKPSDLAKVFDYYNGL